MSTTDLDIYGPIPFPGNKTTFWVFASENLANDKKFLKDARC